MAGASSRTKKGLIDWNQAAGISPLGASHPSHSPELRARLADIAIRLGLLQTGGSDWHGDPEPGETHGALGSQDVPLEWLERLEELRAGPPAPVPS